MRTLYVHAEERANWLRNMAAAGEIRNAELMLRRKDGRKIVVLENSRAVRDEHGRDHLLRRHADRHHRGARAVAATVVRSEPRRALRPDQPPRVRDPPAARARFGAGDRHERTPCAISISISSRSSTIPAATSRATSCCDSSRRCCRAACAATTRWHDSAATSSGCCCTTARSTDAIEHRRTRCSRPSSSISSCGAASTFSVGASIGLVPLSGNFRRITQVLQAADAACYAAKDQGRNRVHVYQEDDAVVAQRHGEMQWVARVKRALSENRFLLEAQPIVPMQDRRRAAAAPQLRVAAAHARRGRAASCRPAHSCRRWSATTCRSAWIAGSSRRRCIGWPRIRRRTQRIARVFVNLSGDSVGDPQLHDFIRDRARRDAGAARRRSASRSPRPRRSAI